MKTEIVTFLTQKESQYDERRARVLEYCRGEGRESFSRHVVPFSLLYNTEEGVSVCLIPKVASTTWLGHFASIGRLLSKMTTCSYFFNRSIHFLTFS